ncbi:MAG: hypothetical protein VW518_09730, partial [Burkholderiaceae bacterium]
MSVAASLGMDSVRGNDAITGNTGRITISGGFGSLGLVASEETCNGIVGQGAGANIDDLDIGFDCGGATDLFTYALPAFGSVTASVLVTDNGSAYGSGGHLATVYY